MDHNFDTKNSPHPVTHAKMLTLRTCMGTCRGVRTHILSCTPYSPRTGRRAGLGRGVCRTGWVPWWELFTGRVVGTNCAGPYSCTNIFMQGWGFRRGITLIPVYHLYKKQDNFPDLSLDNTAQNTDIYKGKNPFTVHNKVYTGINDIQIWYTVKNPKCIQWVETKVSNGKYRSNRYRP